MSRKHLSEPTDTQIKERLKEFSRKHREKYPTPPFDENEPTGLLAGNPDKINARTEGRAANARQGQAQGEKPKLKPTSKEDTNN
ncbi:hypothetical protein ACJJIK_18985 [Microbulbifer sp. ZKSA006]|uniref:hypothetical protein n=1 Tax=Microbulbifer sp. ZKSA006 TaxID=3243390 RepID=UPI00403909BA